jgi:hypothetical protein
VPISCGPSLSTSQGLGNALVAPLPAVAIAKGAVQRRTRLGGLLGYYHREAA